MATNGQSTLPLGLPCKKSQEASPSCAQSKAQMDHPIENFLTIGSYFECYAYRVMVLGWLMKDRKKMNKSDLRLFQVCHFKIACCYYCRLAGTYADGFPRFLETPLVGG